MRKIQKNSGFTYLALLFIVAITGASLSFCGQLWQKTMQQEKERQLLFEGNQFRKAILLYYEHSPSGNKQFPKDLKLLLNDDRFPLTQRYLREIYKDPITGQADWGTVVGPDNRIMGIFSKSEQKPLKSDNFPEKYAQFALSEKYSDWKFVYQPTTIILNGSQH